MLPASETAAGSGGYGPAAPDVWRSVFRFQSLLSALGWFAEMKRRIVDRSTSGAKVRMRRESGDDPVIVELFSGDRQVNAYPHVRWTPRPPVNGWQTWTDEASILPVKHLLPIALDKYLATPTKCMFSCLFFPLQINSALCLAAFVATNAPYKTGSSATLSLSDSLW